MNPILPTDRLSRVELEQAIPAYLKAREPMPPTTAKTYRSVLHLFGQAQPEEPQGWEPAVRAWLSARIAAGCSAATVELHAVVLRGFTQWLVSQGRLAPGAALGKLALPRPEKVVHQRASLSGAQAQHLVDQVEASRELAGKRARAIVALMLRAGLRSCEVVRARVADLQELRGTKVLWVQGKGRLAPDAFVVLNPKTERALADYLGARGPLAADQPLVTGLAGDGKALSERQVQRVVSAVLSRAGLKSRRVTPHSLRHTAASLAIDAQASLSSVQAMMRHADPRTTARYVHLQGRLTRPAEAALNF